MAWPAGAVWADKPRIAVLGLEVAPGPGGAIDPGAQLIAREITKELRQRVQSPACPYAMAPNSNKDLHDEKLLMSCENEAPDCMVVIGAGLASDALLYGRVEKRGPGFRISLKLLDVKRKQVQPAVDELPGGGGVPGVSRRLYRALIGTGPGGSATLVVRARSEGGGAVRGGTVIIDDEPRGQLVHGTLMVTDVDEGRHTVAISVGGFRRFEQIVTVRGGEQVALDAEPHGLPATTQAVPPASVPAADAPSAGRSGLWKVSLVGGAVVAAAGGAYAWHSYDRQKAGMPHFPKEIGVGNCGETDDQLLARGVSRSGLDAFRDTCRWHRNIFYGYALAGVGAAAAVVSLIVLNHRVSAGRPASGAAIAPLFAPDLAGAQLALVW